MIPGSMIDNMSKTAHTPSAATQSKPQGTPTRSPYATVLTVTGVATVTSLAMTRGMPPAKRIGTIAGTAALAVASAVHTVMVNNKPK